jgi:hypothetical protein
MNDLRVAIPWDRVEMSLSSQGIATRRSLIPGLRGASGSVAVNHCFS